MKLHPKIKELKLIATPYTRSSMMVDRQGKLIDDRTVEGYCCVWGVRDDRGTGWLKGCFSKSIQERGPKSNSKYKIVALWQHRMDNPIGRVIELEEDDYGLRFKIEFDEIYEAERCLLQIRSGTINQFSFGFDYIWDQMYYDEKMDTIWVKEAALYEISPVTLASMEETYAIRSADDYDSQKEILDEETEFVIKSLPRTKQLEVRQLISRHVSLIRAEPPELRQKALGKQPEPEQIEEDQLDLSFIINNQNSKK